MTQEGTMPVTKPIRKWCCAPGCTVAADCPAGELPDGWRRTSNGYVCSAHLVKEDAVRAGELAAQSLRLTPEEFAGAAAAVKSLSAAIDAGLGREPPDLVNHPPYYKAANGMEVIDVIEAFALDFRLGNAVKYILRAGRKGDAVEDLRKAEWYLKRAIAEAEDA